MKKPFQVGITGGIGTGKSLICKVFALLNVPVYDADSRAKTVMTTDGILMQAIKKEFGVLSYNPDGSLNSKHLAEHVFAEQSKLERLNQLVHPRVAEDYSSWVLENRTASYVIKEAALLFESGSYKQLDAIVLIKAPEQLRIKRVLKRDPQRNVEQIKEIMKRQLKIEEAIPMADYIINNDESHLVLPQVLELHNRFIKA